MEKGGTNRTNRHLRRIVITGPESTGKSTLAEQLARYFGTIWVPEYAREYVSNLGENYEYNDLVRIGKKQIEELTSDYPNAERFVFFDTGLIITQIWFMEKYKECPTFIDQAIRDIQVELYLLCRPDIDWRKDPVRENSGTDRERLFRSYENALRRNRSHYKTVEGTGDVRLSNAVQIILQTVG